MLLLALSGAVSAHAADIGGFMAQQSGPAAERALLERQAAAGHADSQYRLGLATALSGRPGARLDLDLGQRLAIFRQLNQPPRRQLNQPQPTHPRSRC